MQVERSNFGTRNARPSLELGVIVQIGEVPVVLGRMRDPQLVRRALETVIESAGGPTPATDRELTLFRALLTQTARAGGPALPQQTEYC
jgi:hypothetical protein